MRRLRALACLSLLAAPAAVPADAAPCGRGRADRLRTWYVSTPKAPENSQVHTIWHGGGGAIRASAIDPVNPRVVFAAAGAFLLRSNDGGCSWTQVYRLPAAPAVTVPDADTGAIIGIDASRAPGNRTRVLLLVHTVPQPSQPGRLVVVRSDDGYRDWTAATEFPATFGKQGPWVPSLHTAGGVTYAAVPGVAGGVTYHRSADGGKTWAMRTTLPDPKAPASIVGFAASPWRPDELWEWGGRTAVDDERLTGLRRSTDGGASWSPVDPWPAYAAGDKPTWEVADVAWPRKGGAARVLVLGGKSNGTGEDTPVASWSGDGGQTFSLAVPPTHTTPLKDATVASFANGDAVIVATNRMVYRLAHRGRAPRRGDWTFLAKVPEPGGTWPTGNDQPTRASGTRPGVVTVRSGARVQFLAVP
ncbi:MAG TPA: sialidase family protein [Frankiaceae bacterium]|nr:sialidase family protein [Frankiaceae bacterium]